jgi:hypothetical protein
MHYFRNNSPRSAVRDSHSRGVALAVVLVIMTILTLMGVILILQTDSNMIGAKNEKDVAICRQAAESATRQGLDLAGGFYDTTTKTFKTTILGCTGTTYDACPQGVIINNSSDMASKFIVDRPGHTFDAAWAGKLFINTGNAGNVYVTIYARNNVDETNAAVITDKDGRITIVGEAVMTFDGAAPLANRSNVRVRKMIAADIIQPQLGGTGCQPDVHNQNSNYGC